MYITFYPKKKKIHNLFFIYFKTILMNFQLSNQLEYKSLQDKISTGKKLHHDFAVTKNLAIIDFIGKYGYLNFLRPLQSIHEHSIK